MLQVARILKVHRRYLVGIGNSFRRNILLCLCLEKGGKFMENKAESLSKQALNMVPGYFADGGAISNQHCTEQRNPASSSLRGVGFIDSAVTEIARRQTQASSCSG